MTLTLRNSLYVLSKQFNENKINAWIDGYDFLVERNSPIDSQYILESSEDIDAVIHNKRTKGISPKTMAKIVKLLENYSE